MSETILTIILTGIIELVHLITGSNFPLSLSRSNQGLLISVTIATPSAYFLDNPKTSSSSSIPIINTTPAADVPWGTTEKIGDHLYRTYVSNDNKMGTPDEIIAALNSYRRNHGAGDLTKYDKLCPLAQKRADDQQKAGTLDSHQGLKDYMEDPSHWQELEITGIGENASYGYILTAEHLIEWIFDSDEEHRSNQLNTSWHLVCPAISGETVNILFGKK